VQTITAGRVGRIYITKKQWDETLEFAGKEELIPLVSVEFIIRGKQLLYWCLQQGIVDQRMKANGATFTVWQTLKWGSKIGEGAFII